MKLVSASGFYWQYSDKKWTLPDEGEKGFIETLDKTQVLGVDGELIKEANITLQSKNVSDSVHQLWEKGIADPFGYFTIKSSASDLYLASTLNCFGWPQCLNSK